MMKRRRCDFDVDNDDGDDDDDDVVDDCDDDDNDKMMILRVFVINYIGSYNDSDVINSMMIVIICNV